MQVDSIVILPSAESLDSVTIAAPERVTPGDNHRYVLAFAWIEDMERSLACQGEFNHWIEPCYCGQPGTSTKTLANHDSGGTGPEGRGKLEIVKNRFREADAAPLLNKINFEVYQGYKFVKVGSWYK
jgi:hypothetical protein